MGLNQKQSVFILYLVTTILGLFAVLLTAKGPVRWLLLLTALVLTSSSSRCSTSGAHEPQRRPHDDKRAAECPKDEIKDLKDEKN